jgi:hypothetical protein
MTYFSYLYAAEARSRPGLGFADESLDLFDVLGVGLGGQLGGQKVLHALLHVCDTAKSFDS